ncbi:Crp/Fnr family transcriptional regulator [Iodobacter ciconiae]|uniref:Crp/Fnr family transcriptional regulator n=1 Tax=Iodobacter ciconiae TaxID=2496266 RepID=A0A3S8ZWU5_9NEIS|nr:Crp/Fnr family transcriptional regulator [Iodobacter ciconiae]AZN37970.1 Crp/Fnr family transcriptional regulator [Iodobacter ciconiae]
MTTDIGLPPFLPFLFPLLSALPDEVRAALIQSGSQHLALKGDIIWDEGFPIETVLFLSDGALSAMSNTEMGKRSFLYGLMPAGSIAGLHALFEESETQFCLSALQDSHYLLVPLDRLSAALDQHPPAWKICAKELAVGTKFLLNFVNLLANTNGYKKLRTLLLWLDRRAAMSPNQFGLKLSQQDIAARIGLSREMVNRMLAGLKEGGYISLDERGHFRIIKPLPAHF